MTLREHGCTPHPRARNQRGPSRRLPVLLLLSVLGGCSGSYDSICSSPVEDLGLLVVTGACGAIWMADEATRRAEQAAARTTGAEQARARHRTWLLRDASAGDDAAAYRLAVLLAFEQHPDATKWACHAASNGHRPARVLLASWFNPEQFESRVTPAQITPDPGFAYAWYTLATDRKDPAAESFRRRLAAGLTASERAEADRMVKEWRPGLCPRPTRRPPS